MGESESQCSRGRRKILQVTALPFPPAIRVVKEAISLVEAGYQSAVMCPPIEGRPETEIWNGITIFRPECLRGSKRFPDKLLYHTLLFSPSWYRSFKRVVAEWQPDVLHIHDIWLGRTAFLARKGQRMVMDLHENMPAAVVEYLAGYRGLFKTFNVVFKNNGRVFRYEKQLLKRSDKVFVVVEEAKKRVHESHPELSNDKVVNIENLESKRFTRDALPDGKRILPDGNSILYIGGFGPHRGIDTLVEAQEHLMHWGIDATLYLVGAKESSFLQMIKSLIQRLGVGKRVQLVGWVPASSVLNYINEASICTVPHHSNPHTDTTIPHKLYQYMIARRPVLVSSSPPLARTVRAAKAGLVFEAGNAKDCAAKIRDILSDPESANECANSGFRYVSEAHHNWEEESAPALIRTYDEMLRITQ